MHDLSTKHQSVQNPVENPAAQQDARDLFLLPVFSARGSKRRAGGLIAKKSASDSGFATAGLFSVIAACGGSDSSSGPKNYTIDAGLLEYTDPTPQTYLGAPYGVFSSESKVIPDFDIKSATSSVTVKGSGEGQNSVVGLKSITITIDTTITATFNSKADATGSLAFIYGDIDGEGAADEVIISDTSPNGSSSIIWDFTNQITENNSSFTVGDNTLDKTIIVTDTSIVTTYASFSAASSAKIDQLDNALILTYGYSITTKEPEYETTGYIVVWDIEDYKTNPETITISDFALNDKSKKLLFIESLDVSGKDGNNNFVMFKLDGFDKVDFITNEGIYEIGALRPSGAIRIIWDIADYHTNNDKGSHGALYLEDSAVLTVSGNAEDRFGQSPLKFIDLDGDGLQDILAANNQDSNDTHDAYIFWTSALVDARGNGRSGKIILKDSAADIQADAGNISNFAGEENGFNKIGLWINAANNFTDSREIFLGIISANFWFSDLDEDGILDAVSKRENGDTSHNWWKMTGGKNVLKGNQTDGYYFDDGKAGTADTLDASKAGVATADDLFMKHGILASTAQRDTYVKHSVNSDVDYYADLIEQAGTDGKHKVWLGNKAGTFDTSRSHDFEVTATGTLAEPNAGNSLSDGFSDALQAIDIA